MSNIKNGDIVIPMNFSSDTLMTKYWDDHKKEFVGKECRVTMVFKQSGGAIIFLKEEKSAGSYWPLKYLEIRG